MEERKERVGRRRREKNNRKFTLSLHLDRKERSRENDREEEGSSVTSSEGFLNESDDADSTRTRKVLLCPLHSLIHFPLLLSFKRKKS